MRWLKILISPLRPDFNVSEDTIFFAHIFSATDAVSLQFSRRLIIDSLHPVMFKTTDQMTNIDAESVFQTVPSAIRFFVKPYQQTQDFAGLLARKK